MKAAWLVLVMCPAIASAQDPEFKSRWMLEGSGGVSLRPNDGTSQSLGVTTALTVGRTMSPRVSWRAGFEFQTWESDDPHNPNPFSLLATTFGFLATQTAYDRRFYATGRLGLYMLSGKLGPHPGGYVGVGAAVPFQRGAFTLEAGVQGYLFLPAPGPDDLGAPNPGLPAPTADHQHWAVPIRVGFRWLS